jgi:Peptidase family M28/PDZ domain
MFPQRTYFLAASLALFVAPIALAEDAHLAPAIDSVTAAELYDHVATLADDVFEGRLEGSRGGRAAGQYIAKQLRASHLTPGGTEDGYFQPCDGGGRNILAIVPGADPQLAHEFIVVGAHYDHVGDGRQGHANGPIGQIYNGADDNASGVAALLEMIEAISDSGIQPRRSILFAFWDGEEMGMLGSNYWFTSPTIPPSSIKLDVNIDMIGRLRDGQLHVLGTRTGYGLRRLLSGSVDDALQLDFSWELTANSDHWPFVERQIPIVMLHTGLHEDYHRPGDDAEKINRAGLEKITRYLLATVVEMADADALPAYRPARRYESLAAQRRQQNSLVSVQIPAAAKPSRLGISWRTDDAEPASVYLSAVVAGSPADAAGLAVDDRIYAINGKPFADAVEFRKVVVGLLDAGAAEFTLLVETRGHLRTVSIHWHPHKLAARTGT